MGRINTILSFVRTFRNDANVTDVKCDPGGGANVTAEHFSAPGDDSFPLTTDVALTVPVTGSGREAAVGYLDPVNEQKAASGEKRIYARDSSGAEVADIWIKNTGAVVIENENGVMSLNPDGSSIMENDAGSIELAADGTITNLSGIGSLTMTPLGLATLTNGIGTFLMLADGSFSINGLIITPAGVMISAAGKNSDTHTHAQGADSNGDSQVNTGAPL